MTFKFFKIKAVDNQSLRNKITFSATLGLVVHSAGIYFKIIKISSCLIFKA